MRDLLTFLRARGRPVPSLEGLALLAAAHASAPEGHAATLEALTGLLFRGDVTVARAMVLDPFRAGRHLDEMLDRLVGPAMADIGTQWAEGKVDVYQEHAATLRAWSILAEVRALLPAPPDTGPPALGGAPEGDPYLLPCLMAELALAEIGWRTISIGPNTPIESFVRVIGEHEPRLVWLSVTSQSSEARVLDAMRACSRWLGTAACTWRWVARG